jgi:hypothetical protein
VASPTGGIRADDMILSACASGAGADWLLLNTAGASTPVVVPHK